MPRLAATVALAGVLWGGANAHALDVRSVSLLAGPSDATPSAVGLGEAGRAHGWLLAQADQIERIKTRDGRVHVGKVLKEEQRGYLFRELDGTTYVIEYDQIVPGATAAPREQPAPSEGSAPPTSYSPPPVGELSAPPLLTPEPLEPAPAESGRPSAAQRSRIREIERELADEREGGLPIVAPLVTFGLSLGFDGLALAGCAGSFGSVAAATGLITIAALMGTAFGIVGTVLMFRYAINGSRRAGRIKEYENELHRLRKGFSQAEPQGPLVVVARF